MQNLDSPGASFHVDGAAIDCGPATGSAVAAGVMAVVQSLENLEKIMPDGVLGNGSVLFRRLFDNGREVAATTVFHEDVENASVPVDVCVVVSYNVVVMQVFEDVAR
jgi:uncharacterized alkaline shock family protein YloU